MHVREAGSGTPVVLLHAFPVDGRMYRAQLDDPPARLIVPDLPGFGRTPPRPIATLDDYAREVVSLLDERSIERAVIGGTSMGGYITFALLRLAPERFSGVILADTKMTADTEEGKTQRETTARKALSDGVEAVLEGMLPKLIHRSEAEPAVREFAGSASPDGVAAALRAMAVRPDSTSAANAIGVPALIICGEHDALSSVPEHEAMRDAITSSRLEVIPGAGHLAALESPAEFTTALRAFVS